jgi:hypothetical protein
LEDEIRGAAHSPTLFEQLVYDLTILSGLANVTWRTPGSDGGRDIEGEFQTTDFSGILRFERWYVECKRYKAAIDWPTIHNKIAHAAAFGADYLLVCTTSTLSPSCKDALGAYAVQHVKPRVRAWEGAELELRVQREPALLVKYGLGTDRRDVDGALAPLNEIVAKLVHVVYGEQSAVGNASASLEAASALVELVGRLATINPRTSPTPKARRLRLGDIHPWIVQNGNPGELIDAYVFRAIAAGLRFLAKSERLDVIFVDERNLSISFPTSETMALKVLLDAICTPADWEWRQSGDVILFEVRREK